MIYDIYPARGSFVPGMSPELIVEHPEDVDEVELVVYRGAELVGYTREALKTDTEQVSPDKKRRIRLEFTSSGGYGVEAKFYYGEVLKGIARTAFDILPQGKQIRYGFLSDFSSEDKGEEDIISMLKLHINTVQFYDWSYRHDSLVAPTEQFSDMMGKKNDLSVIRQKIESCHAYGMSTLGYGAVYAASKEYRDAHPKQSLYDPQGRPLCFIDTFYIMNVDGKNGWHSHILEQYRSAVAEMDFDGIHMDTYGDPKRALDIEGKIVYLEEHFPELIDHTRMMLENEKKDITLIFNNVGGWPVEHTMYTSQSAVYIEVWPPNITYQHLGNLITVAKLSKKPVILAAYPAAFRLDLPERALEGELLLSFVIAMYGATQLFFGEENAVITQGYYADYTVLTEYQLQAIREYQDFFVQYQECFYDYALEDVSMTHQEWDNKEFRFSPVGSADGQSGKIWYHIRQSKWKKVIYFVNLTENNNLWNEGKDMPVGTKRITVELQMLKEPRYVWFAEPGKHGNKAKKAEYTWKWEKQSKMLCTEVEIFRCGILVIEE